MPTDQIGQFDLKANVLGEQVSRILTEAILEGVLKGGDKLVEAELQKKFNISRSPLREAFRDLEKMGLVRIVPRKGTYVKRITHKDVEDNFPVRSALEGMAAAEAHKKMTNREKRQIADALEKMEAAVEEKDTKKYWKYHLKFHEGFIDACGNDVLINILKTLRMHSMYYRFAYQYYQEGLSRFLDTHKKINELFQDPHADQSEIAKLVQNHIEVAYERFLVYLENQGEEEDSSLN